MIIARRIRTGPCFPRRTICCSRRPSSSLSRRARTGSDTTSPDTRFPHHEIECASTPAKQPPPLRHVDPTRRTFVVSALARTVYGAVLLVNGRSAVRSRSPAPSSGTCDSPLTCVYAQEERKVMAGPGLLDVSRSHKKPQPWRATCRPGAVIGCGRSRVSNVPSGLGRQRGIGAGHSRTELNFTGHDPKRASTCQPPPACNPNERDLERGTRRQSPSPCTSTYVGQRGLGIMCPWLEGQEAIPEVAALRRRAPEGLAQFPPAARSLPQPEPGSALRVMNAPLCGR